MIHVVCVSLFSESVATIRRKLRQADFFFEWETFKYSMENHSTVQMMVLSTLKFKICEMWKKFDFCFFFFQTRYLEPCVNATQFPSVLLHMNVKSRSHHDLFPPWLTMLWPAVAASQSVLSSGFQLLLSAQCSVERITM